MNCLTEMQIIVHLFSIIIIGYEPPFTCVPDNATDIWNNLTTVSSDQCYVVNGSNANVSAPCVQWHHSGEDKATITAELKLVCADRYKVQLAQTLLIAGQAVGASLFSVLSDRYGRKFILIISEVALLIVTFVTAFVPYAWMFLVMRFLTGMTQQGLVMTSFILRMELIKTEYRTLAGVVVMSTFSLSGCLLALLGYLFREESWRHLQLVLSLSGLVVIVIHIIFLDESVRWLLAKSKTKQAYDILAKAYRKNNVKDPSVLARISKTLGLDYSDESSQSFVVLNHKKKYDVGEATSSDTPPETSVETSPLIVLKNAFTRKATILLAYIWMANSFVYFSNTLLSSTLAGDRFLNLFISCLVEGPAAVASYICLKWFGRKKTLIIWQIVIALISLTSSLSLLSSDVPFWVRNLFWIVAKFSVSVTFGALFIYTPELYPTKFRNIGLGIGSSSSRVGGMIAPFMVYLLDIATWLPGPIFSSVALLACVFALPLPETVHVELAHTFEQLETLWRQRQTRRPARPV